ncbi:hypothetical protein F2Q70_00007144 [Brassica cretica]|uniref:PRA1 family protein n=1 Tax=Brassica cretica TaxID=69181 RepID=A0A8S9MD54_BRACR|nr:hypothetical protein F2Q70_00007144 [Brassica cretica]
MSRDLGSWFVFHFERETTWSFFNLYSDIKAKTEEIGVKCDIMEQTDMKMRKWLTRSCSEGIITRNGRRQISQAAMSGTRLVKKWVTGSFRQAARLSDVPKSPLFVSELELKRNGRLRSSKGMFLFCSFAASFNEKFIRTIRLFSPHLAAKMRPPHMPVIRGRSAARKTIYVCGKPRWVFVVTFLTASLVMWFSSCGLLWVLYAFLTSLAVIIVHASVRTPNLKARLNTFREEFRAVWRNYSEL